MSTSAQYLQASYVPTVEWAPNGGSQSILLPDWMNAGYLDLADNVQSYELYTVTQDDLSQPDAIAWKKYGIGNGYWWWVICDYNGIVDPYEDLYIGQQLKIPSLLEVTTFLENLRTTTNQRANNIGTYVTI